MATATDQRSLRRRFFRLTGINILTNLTVPLAGLVDTALLGHLPDIRFLAGVALAALGGGDRLPVNAPGTCHRRPGRRRRRGRC
jgi:hypothetical protein